MNVLLDITLIFSKGDVWPTTEDLERDLAGFFASKGLEAERMVNPSKLALSLTKKTGDFPSVTPPPQPAVNPNAGAKPKEDRSELLNILDKATEANKKPKLRVFRGSIL